MSIAPINSRALPSPAFEPAARPSNVPAASRALAANPAGVQAAGPAPSAAPAGNPFTPNMSPTLSDPSVVPPEVASYLQRGTDIAATLANLSGELANTLASADVERQKSLGRQLDKVLFALRSAGAGAAGRVPGGAITDAVINGRRSEAESKLRAVVTDNISVDPNLLVQWVLRESYMQTTLELRDYAEKVRTFNEQKKAIRAHLTELRGIRTKLAGVSEEDAATTRIDGTPIKNPGGAGAGASGAAAGETPMVGSSTERRELYGEEIDNQVAGFTDFEMDSHDSATSLEKAMLDDPSMRSDLVAAIPYMTPAELRKVLGALGGGDMILDSELEGLFGEIVAAMTPAQVLDLAAKPNSGYGPFGLVALTEAGQFGPAFHRRQGEVLNDAEAKLGALPKDPAEREAYISQYRNLFTGESDAAGLDAEGGGDKTARDAINALNDSNPSGTVTTKEVVDMIGAATSDLDSRAATTEYEALKAWVGENWERMTPDARAAWGAYEEQALKSQQEGNTGIPKSTYDEMMAGLNERVATSSDEAFLEDAQRQEEERIAEGRFDLDPSDGSIDKAEVLGAPPFLWPTDEKITTVAELDGEIQALEEKLSSVGDDAQLANVDLQNVLQKQQQTLQLMSNIAKQLHDTALAIIRKIGG